MSPNVLSICLSKSGTCCIGSRRVADQIDQSRGCILIEGSEDVIVFRLVGRDATKAKLCLGLRKPNLRLRGPKGWHSSEVTPLVLWRLPEDIRIQLVDAKVEDPRELARRADALSSTRSMGGFAAVNAVQRKQTTGGKKQTKPVPRGPTPDPYRLCFYHRTFGEAARQCRQPCAWSGNDKVSC